MDHIYKSLQGIEKELFRLSGLVESNAKWAREGYDRHQASLEKHEGTLYGNGQEGMTTMTKRNTDTLVLYRWIIGLVMTMDLAILVKLFIQ